MCAALRQLNQRPAFITAPPAGLLAHLQHRVEFAVLGAVLSQLVGAPLAHDADAGLAILTHGLKRMLGVGLVAGGDELAAGCVGAKDARLPGRAVLHDLLEEQLLLVSREHHLDDGAGYGLGAAPGRHLGLVRHGLGDHDGEAIPAVCVAAGQRLQGIVFSGEVLAAAYARPTRHCQACTQSLVC